MGVRRLFPLISVLVAACSAAPPSPEPHATAATLLTITPTPEPTEIAGVPASASAGPVDTPPAAEAPYDLAADIETRKAKLASEFGDTAKFAVVDDVFLIVAPSGIFVGAPPIAKQALAAYFNGRFKKRPERAVTVLVFVGDKPYEAYCEKTWSSGCGTPFGFYKADVRTLVMNLAPGVGTLTHEIVHPIVEADFPSAPDWINEGIASLYEAYSMPAPGEIAGQRNFRLPALRTALKSETDRADVALPKLFAMSDKEFRGPNESLNYATARYFCMWLEGKKKLWPFYQAWRDGYENDKSGEKAFLATMGKTPEEMNEDWSKWVLSL